MTIDTAIFESFKSGIGFTGDMKDFVYGMACGFDGLDHINFNTYEHLLPFFSIYDYEWVEGVDYKQHNWGVFQFKGVYYKAYWDYCNTSYEMDYYGILDNLSIVKPVQKVATTWEILDDN